MNTPSAFQALLSPRPALYTVPNGRPFLADIATTLFKAYQDDISGLAKVTIYTPNKRASRTLAEAFYKLARGQGAEAVILPRLRALGEVDEEDLLLAGALPELDAILPPAADRVERRLLLTQLIMRLPDVNDWPSALRAADELSKLLDALHLDDVPTEQLETLLDDEVSALAATHWQQGLEFISIVTKSWPEIAKAQGWMDPSARSHQLTSAFADAITGHSNTDPIVIAGSLGTVAATGKLLKAAAEAPNGLVVLPGFDPGMDDRAWAAIDPPHPQALFRDRLVRDFGDMERGAVQIWPGSEHLPPHIAKRHELISLSLRPARATDQWYEEVSKLSDADLATTCQHVQFAVGKTSDEEAMFIALAIRQALETPDKTTMLVTPDRELAQRVSAKLSNWGIRVDDTGGTPLPGTYRGTFLRLVAQWCEDPSNPEALMGMLQHPLAAMGREAADWGGLTRALNRILRGRRIAYDFPALISGLETTDWQGLRGIPAQIAAQQENCLTILKQLQQWHDVWSSASSIADQISAHTQLAEHLAATKDHAGEARMWVFEDGEMLASHLRQLIDADVLSKTAPDKDRYSALFDSLLAGGVVRKRGGHPRIKIFGLLEARLQTADLVILGALNDGVWPNSKDNDPFLSRPMREKLGLPTSEHLIGRAAHDFIQAAAAPSVLLTRSARSGGAPMSASRWLVRWQSLLSHRNWADQLDVSAQFRGLADGLHRADGVQSLSQPRPKPPLARRPRSYSISNIEVLLRDPYSIFATKVLGFYPMDPLNADTEIRERGSFFHQCAEEFAAAHPKALPDNLEAEIAGTVLRVFEKSRFPEHLWTEWTKARSDFCAFLAIYEQEARSEGLPLGMEAEGRFQLAAGGEEFTIRGIADRIDAMDGGVSIIDFKSSEKVPTDAQKKTFSPQLLLLAMMIESGGFKGIPAALCHRVAYLKFKPPTNGSVFGSASSVESDELRSSITSAYGSVSDNLAAYHQAVQPYLSQPRPQYLNDFGDFDHLARRLEWASEEDGDD